jgi:hypothetical protein
VLLWWVTLLLRWVTLLLRRVAHSLHCPSPSPPLRLYVLGIRAGGTFPFNSAREDAHSVSQKGQITLQSHNKVFLMFFQVSRVRMDPPPRGWERREDPRPGCAPLIARR